VLIHGSAPVDIAYTRIPWSPNMSTASHQAVFQTANPHALATILDAAETRRIIACRDIFDLSGTKLWARDQPVSQALQRKLMDRKLRQPLEACLMAEDGVTATTLRDTVQALLGLDTALAELLRPHAGRIADEVPRLPLHPVVQLLLTAAQSSRPAQFVHAVQAMALNGALALARGATTVDLRMALLAGLMHDLGEMYIDPVYGEAEADRQLDVSSYEHLVVHPHVGHLLVSQLTDYPPRLARAIAEHHERLDGSGYPHRLRNEQISPQGRLLAVTEATLGVLRSDRAGAPEAAAALQRASVALRVVPGEFDMAWIGPVASAARPRTWVESGEPDGALLARLAALDGTLICAQHQVDAVRADPHALPLHPAMELARYLLARLRTGWNASGLWSEAALRECQAGEIDRIEEELRYRLRGIARAVHLHAGHQPPELALLLERLCEGFEVVEPA
jgi:HD-GYP domain-containing protein (c-di-GMP phosphodiesterase class II)